MRFPWLQVDADFIAAHASDLGAQLGISRREAIGIAVDLWTWALARAPDGAPPDGMVTGTGTVPDRLLSGSVGWTGPVEQFTGALVACGLAVKIDSGYRLTGFSRYKATWEKNRRRSGPEPDRNRTGTGEDPARKTQTQKETTDLPPPASASAAPEQAGLPGVDPPTPPAKPAKKAKEAKKPEAPQPEPVPFKAACDMLTRVYADVRKADYGFGLNATRNGKAVRELLWGDGAKGQERGEPLVPLEEVERRWRIGLAWKGFPACNAIWDLKDNWAAYAQHQDGRHVPDGLRPSHPAACGGCGAQGQGGAVGDPEVWLGYECGCLPAFTEAQSNGLHFTKAAEWAATRRRAA